VAGRLLNSILPSSDDGDAPGSQQGEIKSKQMGRNEEKKGEKHVKLHNCKVQYDV
jgi:hypothetical protein